VKLFANVLPAVGGRAVVVKAGGEKIGPCLLEAAESREMKAMDVMMVLHSRSCESGA